tara:strand:+ start:1507 stop:1761 length:255 start_codon:yes stop_codon:yes gene_type:complete
MIGDVFGFAASATPSSPPIRTSTPSVLVICVFEQRIVINVPSEATEATALRNGNPGENVVGVVVDAVNVATSVPELAAVADVAT